MGEEVANNHFTEAALTAKMPPASKSEPDMCWRMRRKNLRALHASKRDGRRFP